MSEPEPQQQAPQQEAKKQQQEAKKQQQAAKKEAKQKDGKQAAAAAAAKKEKKEKKGAVATAAEPAPLPEFVAERVRQWEEIKASQTAQAAAEARPIKVTLPDGRQVEAVAGRTTPADIAASLSQTLAQQALVARVDGRLSDLSAPLSADCALELLTFESADGQRVFWHSSAHVLGQALERHYGGLLCVGPPLDDGGFYYDMRMDGAVTPDDFERLQQTVAQIVKEKQPFERLALSKEQALRMFGYNRYKAQIIADKVPDGASCTAYRCGPLIDLCKGPHVPHTGRIKAFEIFKNSSAYWLGKAENDSLQRVYGISFPDNKQLKEWRTRREEAEKRNHRTIGKVQELFFFDAMSPGCAFFLPYGARIYNALVDFIRSEYRKRGFTEVLTPNFYSDELFKTSGHWANYRENMFVFECEGHDYALKPMNCPGHCLMFAHRARSYRELPLRFADFGVLHRNELSGALTGLTRVRRFQQDDAHIFCQPDKIKEEIVGAFEFMKAVYGIFGFTFDLELSTRPEKYLGELAVWERAEKALTEVLDGMGTAWKLNPGDGAFYGPKIDIHITDAIGRSYQCATIQLDFNLPERFKLEYQTETGVERPVIIHRAVLGSIERFLAILTEHVAGRWPLWLSPRQFLVVPISDKFDAYAEQVQRAFHEAGFFVEAELSDKTFQKKMLNARQQGFHNYYLVVGEKEQADSTVNIRTRDNEVVGAKSLVDAINDFKREVAEHK